MSTASPGIAFPAAPSERCTVTPCASRTFAWQVYVLLHGDNVLTDILVAIDAAVHVQGLQAAKVRESVFKLSSCLQSTLKFSSPAARYRCTISSPAAGLGRAILSDPFLELALHFQLEGAGSHSSPARGRPRRLALVAGLWLSPSPPRRLSPPPQPVPPPPSPHRWRRCRRSCYACGPLLAAATAAHRPSSNGHRSLSASRVRQPPWPCVSVNVSLCAQPVVDWWFNRPRHMGAKTKGFRVLSL